MKLIYLLMGGVAGFVIGRALPSRQSASYRYVSEGILALTPDGFSKTFPGGEEPWEYDPDLEFDPESGGWARDDLYEH